MRYQIRTEHGRTHELSERQIDTPNAYDNSRQTRYGVKVRPGNWIVYREEYTDQSFARRVGRVLGRVEAPAVPDAKYPCERIDGHISVLALANDLSHAYIRWVDPADVLEVRDTPPAKLLAWITGELPNPEMVHKLSAYGTLSERHIDKVDHHVTAWRAGMSPAAYDATHNK